jgi:hypothetical protein
MVKNLLTMLILYRYIWLVYVYFGLSADFDYRANSPHHYRESLLYLEANKTGDTSRNFPA